MAHLQRERTIGPYAAAAADGGGENDARAQLATLLNCETDEVALAESAQRAWALALTSLKLGPSDRILCFRDEYAGNAVAFLQLAEQTGCQLEVLPMRPDGVVDVPALQAALQEATTTKGPSSRHVIALTHINTDSSVIQPAAKVGQLAKAHGAIYLLDACQSIGAMPVDVEELGCDFACGTGRKWLRGPRGTGFLYARKTTLLEKENLVGTPATIDHTSVAWTSRNTYDAKPDARRYEMWESSIAARVGLAAAVKLCNEVGPERIQALSTSLARRLRAGLRTVDGVVLRDAPEGFDEDDALALGGGQCAHVTFEVESKLGIKAPTVHAELLHAHKIATSVSPSGHTFEDSLWSRPLVVRMSPSYYNTEEEVEAVVEAVREVVGRLA